jgi:hypothetical protein
VSIFSFFSLSYSPQASTMPCWTAVLISGDSVLGSKVFPAPIPIFAKRAISSVSEGLVGPNWSMKFMTLKTSSEVFCSSTVGGLMKSIAGAGLGAG